MPRWRAKGAHDKGGDATKVDEPLPKRPDDGAVLSGEASVKLGELVHHAAADLRSAALDGGARAQGAVDAAGGADASGPESAAGRRAVRVAAPVLVHALQLVQLLRVARLEHHAEVVDRSAEVLAGEVAVPCGLPSVGFNEGGYRCKTILETKLVMLSSCQRCRAQALFVGCLSTPPL